MNLVINISVKCFDNAYRFYVKFPIYVKCILLYIRTLNMSEEGEM